MRSERSTGLIAGNRIDGGRNINSSNTYNVLGSHTLKMESGSTTFSAEVTVSK
jgi:hypothetical protein